MLNRFTVSTQTFSPPPTFSAHRSAQNVCKTENSQDRIGTELQLMVYIFGAACKYRFFTIQKIRSPIRSHFGPISVPFRSHFGPVFGCRFGPRLLISVHLFGPCFRATFSGHLFGPKSQYANYFAVTFSAYLFGPPFPATLKRPP